MVRLLTALRDDESGATAIEYALIAGIISIVVVASVVIIAASLTGTYGDVAGSLA